MSSLAQDLLRWEKGELSLEEVERAHPEAGVRDLMRLHTRLSMLRAIPLPDVDRAWSMTLPRLEGSPKPVPEVTPVRVPARSSRLRDWARRPLAASFAAVVMSGGMAYAAGVEPVQRAVDGMVDRARDMTGMGEPNGGEDEVTTTAPSDASEVDPASNGATPPGKERSDEVRGQGKEKGPNHGRREFGHSHKKDKKVKEEKEKSNEGDRGKDDAPGLTEDPGNGSPPASPGNGGSTKPDKVKDTGDPAAPAGGNAGGNSDVHVDEPAESTDGGGPAPAPPEAPGASGGDHGNGKDKNKSLA